MGLCGCFWRRKKIAVWEWMEDDGVGLFEICVKWTWENGLMGKRSCLVTLKVEVKIFG